MKLSELYELSPLAWEEAKRETIRQKSGKIWERMVKEDTNFSACFIFFLTDNEKMWKTLHFDNDTTLLKQWEAKQIELQQNK